MPPLLLLVANVLKMVPALLLLLPVASVLKRVLALPYPPLRVTIILKGA